MYSPTIFASFFFFNDTATTEIYTLSLHDALPILLSGIEFAQKESKELIKFINEFAGEVGKTKQVIVKKEVEDRKSTRLNSSHQIISYAVFCLKKKKTNNHNHTILIR